MHVTTLMKLEDIMLKTKAVYSLIPFTWNDRIHKSIYRK